MIKSKKQSFVVIGIFTLVLMLFTTTYAFFNYTRTGSANTIRTGRIAFNSQQGNSINLTNVFPVDVSNGIPNNNPNVGSVTINVTGDTTYGEGVEYLVSAVNVQNTIGSGANAKQLPISIDVSVASNTGNDPATTLGTADSDYFTNRGLSVQTSIYKVLAGETISNNDQLLVGYIKSGETGVDGNIVIKAYLDASKIAISDTYDGNETDNMGTTTNWVNDRVVFTTSEWNSLQTNGISFQVKIEANEKIWVEEPVVPGTISTCPGCKFMYITNTVYYGGASNVDATQISTLTGVTTDYTTLDKNIFLGFTETQDGKIDRGFVCGEKGENPNNGIVFCVEGTLNDSHGGNFTTRSTVYASNSVLLNDSVAGLWQGECNDYETSLYCVGSVSVSAYEMGDVSMSFGNNSCAATDNGYFYCH